MISHYTAWGFPEEQMYLGPKELMYNVLVLGHQSIRSNAETMIKSLKTPKNQKTQKTSVCHKNFFLYPSLCKTRFTVNGCRTLKHNTCICI